MDSTQSLDELISRYQQNQQALGRAKGTRDRYHYTFLLFRRFLQDHEIEPTAAVLNTSTMEEFATWLRETPINPQHGTNKRAESGIYAHLCDMRALCRWLLRHEYLDKEVHCPMPKVPKRLFKVLDDTEMQRVWNSKFLTGNSGLAIRNRAMLALMLDTGLRRAEVASLTLESISLEKRSVTVIGKGNKERRVFFSAQVRVYLREFLAIRGVDNESLFHLSAIGIRTQFRRIKDELGMEHFHPHLLRHQFATMLYRQTRSMEHVRLLLGHED